MRRAVEQRRGQPRGPQIRGQLAEIHVIVAGDEPVRHVILRSMDAVMPPGGNGPILPRPPLSRVRRSGEAWSPIRASTIEHHPNYGGTDAQDTGDPRRRHEY